MNWVIIKQNKLWILLFILFLALMIFSSINNCPFQHDYVQFYNAINHFKQTGNLNDSVNGKHLFIFIMSLLPSANYKFLVFANGALILVLIYLFYRWSKSVKTTIAVGTSFGLSFLFGTLESAVMASIFMVLYFINRNKKYSEIFILLSTFVRKDFIIYYLFSRKNKLSSYVCFLFSLSYFLIGKHIVGDIGLNFSILYSMALVIISFGLWGYMFLEKIKIKEKSMLIKIIFIALFMILFVRAPSTKIFLFPMILTFFVFRKSVEKIPKNIYFWVVILSIIIISLVIVQKEVYCPNRNIVDFAYNLSHNIDMKDWAVFNDFYNKSMQEPFKYNLTLRCKDGMPFIEEVDYHYGDIAGQRRKICFVKNE